MFIVKTARTLPSSVRSRITSNAQDFPPHSGGLFPSSGGLFPPSGGQFPSYSLEEKSTIVREPALRQDGLLTRQGIWGLLAKQVELADGDADSVFRAFAPGCLRFVPPPGHLQTGFQRQSSLRIQAVR